MSSWCIGNSIFKLGHTFLLWLFFYLNKLYLSAGYNLRIKWVHRNIKKEGWNNSLNVMDAKIMGFAFFGC